MNRGDEGIKLLNGIIVCVFLFTVLLSGFVFAETLVKKEQESPKPDLNLGRAASPFSLFDPAKLEMRHSYSMSYASSGGHGQMIAMYLNEIDYQIAKPLRLHVAVGWVHQPQSFLGLSDQTLRNQLLPNVRLDWKPSDKFHLIFSYETLSPYRYYDQQRYRRFESIFDEP